MIEEKWGFFGEKVGWDLEAGLSEDLTSKSQISLEVHGNKGTERNLHIQAARLILCSASALPKYVGRVATVLLNCNPRCVRWALVYPFHR